MPELPEVETLVRGLSSLSGSQISAVDVLDPRLELPVDAIVGARIESIERRGKYIVLNLADRGSLIVHLRMSGRLVRVQNPGEAKHTRLVLHLTSGEAIYFVNPRRLGTVTYSSQGFNHSLGVEPLSAQFSVEALAELTNSSRAPIKPMMMDQRKIAGIGNIYAAEALWRAGIDPRRAANTLSPAQVAALHRSVIDILGEAIEQMGTSFGASVSDYRNSEGNEGRFQNHLSIYGRQGDPCERCGETIERIVQGGRSTCLCPQCQR